MSDNTQDGYRPPDISADIENAVRQVMAERPTYPPVTQWIVGGRGSGKTEALIRRWEETIDGDRCAGRILVYDQDAKDEIQYRLRGRGHPGAIVERAVVTMRDADPMLRGIEFVFVEEGVIAHLLYRLTPIIPSVVAVAGEVERPPGDAAVLVALIRKLHDVGVISLYPSKYAGGGGGIRLDGGCGCCTYDAQEDLDPGQMELLALLLGVEPWREGAEG